MTSSSTITQKKSINNNTNSTSSSTTTTANSESSASDLLDSDYSDVEEEIADDNAANGESQVRSEYDLDDFQIIKTIGK